MTPPPLESYRVILLTRSQFSVVDTEDYERLSRYRWCATYYKGLGAYYACRSDTSSGKRRTVLMHREILGLVPGDGLHGDHINRNTLDNRRANLRPATPAQNIWNQVLPRTNTSGFKGVWFNSRYRNPWLAMISCNGKKVWLGGFSTPEKAHEAYCAAARLLHGEFARTT